MDEHGYVYLQTEGGFGLVHTQDVGLAASAIEQGEWALQEVLQSSLGNRYGYQQSPQSLQIK
jgi:uncharacterized protein YaiI (UPF0178 family)